MAYDEARQRMVVFGGEPGVGALDDVWEWDGTNWIARATALRPNARVYCGLAYDRSRARIVMYGGLDFYGNVYTDTWEWQDGIWTEQFPATSPGRRVSPGMLFEPRRDRVLLYGGWDQTMPRSDTWQYGTTTDLADYAEFGLPCAHSIGLVPSIHAKPGERPITGSPFTVQVPRYLGGPALMVFGFSCTNWWLLKLPAELSSFSMPGCYAYTDAVEAFLMATGPTTWDWAVTIPNAQELCGTVFYNQAYLFDAQANPRGFVTSDAGVGLIGLR
jgi:hypothetical protein